ncbi:hypothetical protein IAU60_004663 [Kwoniella sp. DSM 27419]
MTSHASSPPPSSPDPLAPTPGNSQSVVHSPERHTESGLDLLVAAAVAPKAQAPGQAKPKSVKPRARPSGGAGPKAVKRRKIAGGAAGTGTGTGVMASGSATPTAMEVDDDIEGLLGDGPDEGSDRETVAGPSVHQTPTAKRLKDEAVMGDTPEASTPTTSASTKKSRGKGKAADWNCYWGECDARFDAQDPLIEHVKDDHIAILKEPFICEWKPCPRTGQTQASRHSLSTHMRMHTGERPYACSYAGCDKAFTRSDALSKHIRAQHVSSALSSTPQGTNSGVALESTTGHSRTGGSSPVKAESPGPDDLVAGPAIGSPVKAGSSRVRPATEAELMLDDDLAEVLPRLRRRERLDVSAEEKVALAEVRKLRPRAGAEGGAVAAASATTGRKRKSTAGSKAAAAAAASATSTAPGELVPDELDEPSAELEIPEEARLVETVPDPDLPAGSHGTVDILSRSEWQARFIMIKARLMLVDEENHMRRAELRELMS